MEHASMVANASTSMRNPRERSNSSRGSRSSSRSSFHSSRSRRSSSGPPIGRTGHRSHAGFTKRVTARGATNARLNMKEHHHQLPHLRVKEPVLRPPNQSESVAAIAEVRGVESSNGEGRTRRSRNETRTRKPISQK